MRTTEARLELQQLLAALTNCRAAVPDRATAFRRALDDLERQIRKAMPSGWWPWADRDRVNEFAHRVELLRQLAQPLAALIESVIRLETEVGDVTQRAGNDPELAAWFQRGQQSRLAEATQFGRTCTEEHQISAQRDRLPQIQQELRRDGEAVDALREAAGLRITIVPGSSGPQLIARLSDLRTQLLGGHVTSDWLNEMRRLMDLLREIAGSVALDPPVEAQELERIRAKVRAWSRQLNDHDETIKMGVRNFDPIDWNTDEGKRRIASEKERLGRLLERARQERDDKRTALQQQVKDFRRACGHDAELDAQLTGIQQEFSDEPHEYQSWLDRFDKVRSAFQALAYRKQGEILARVTQTLVKLKTMAGELVERPLSESIKNSAALIVHDLERPEPSEAEEGLRRLAELEKLEEDLGNLARQADEELRALQEQQQQLADRSHALRVEAARVKVTLDTLRNLSARILGLSKVPAARPPADRRQAAEDLAAELQSLEVSFIERCRTNLARGLVRVQRASEVLRTAGVVPAAADGSVQAVPDAAPHTAAQAVIDAAKLFRLLSRQGRTALVEQEKRTARLQQEIATLLAAADLAPGDRQDAERLERALGTVLTLQNQALFDRLRQVMSRVHDADRFIWRLRQEERNARERLATLRSRLQEFESEQLDEYCPELAQRVTALVFGIPKEPRQWSAVRHQLDAATDLFDRVEMQARRLAADELAGAKEAALRRLRGSTDESFRNSVKSLLDEVDAYGNETLAPVSVRARVIDASEGRTERSSGT